MKDVIFFRFAGRRTFGYEVRIVRFFPRCKTFQGTFTVDVLNADARPEPMALFATIVVIRPKVERETTSEAPPRICEIAGDSRYIKREVERNKKTAPLVRD